ncbi:efflux RND transporter periplasmic adaptor subunit [Prolixibacter sp. NT017]|uniref:efflux RND transporter periplasmic adaptor subunit n=1 Tax=Prolixibacter sp. NT017 TaxID=2652390 RepID=UPI0012704499|nr:efflux RND transporter periplasmic adaptor subunit [Prolixibacter sp. NT017]GET24501.1 secretion protein HlyD [Prolixibacter sp. NT017]
MRNQLFIILATVVLIFTACGRNKNGNNKEAGASGQLQLSREQIAHTNITFGQPMEKNMSDVIPARGMVALPPDGLARINSFSSGSVKRIHVKMGQKVKRGQVLAMLTGPELITMQENYLKSVYSLEMLEKEYQRLQQLEVDNISSRKQLEQAKASYLSEKATAQSLHERLRLLRIEPEKLMNDGIQSEIPVVSPIDGIINQINFSVGQILSPDQMLFEVLDLSRLVLKISVLEKDIPQISVGQNVMFIPSNLGDKPYAAKVTAIGGMVEQTAKVVNVILQPVELPDKLLPGMFVAAMIRVDAHMAKCVPEAALIYDENNNSILFYTEDDPEKSGSVTFGHIQVEPGYRNNGFVEVAGLEQLPANAHVVFDGGYYLYSELLKMQE